jgi:hypothetical protein
MTQIPDGRTELDAKLVHAKRQFEKLMLEYHKFLEDKILHENKSRGQLNAESDFVLRLLKAANDVDVLKYPEPEGTFGLITLLIRTGFFIRDSNNMLEYKNKLLEQKIARFEKQITDLSRVGPRNT